MTCCLVPRYQPYPLCVNDDRRHDYQSACILQRFALTLRSIACHAKALVQQHASSHRASGCRHSSGLMSSINRVAVEHDRNP